MSAGICVSCIVEGHGEISAVPVLVRRIAQVDCPGVYVQVPRPFRVPKDKLIKSGQFEYYVELAAQRSAPRGGVLVLVDSDQDCPAELGPELLDRALRVRPDIPIGVVLAKCEFEAWFLAAADSLRGLRGLPEDLESPAEPEEIRGAKEWLSRHLPPGRIYTATADQVALTAQFDMELAKKARSFEKCYREIRRILKDLVSS